MDLKVFDTILREECGLQKDLLTLAGVSGGPDSLCLLDLLVRCGYPVVAAHYDHRLREESDQDADMVRRVAAQYRIPFALERGDVGCLARERKLSIEEAARTARYNFLFREAKARGAQAVAVAHSADDQVETVLMHLLRGSGLNGLKGMAFRISQTEWGTGVALVRPLLGMWRKDILTYCAEQGLSPVFDKTNQDTGYFRNRLRHELIPYLEDYNPRFKHALWRMSAVIGADVEVIEETTRSAWEKCWYDEGEGYIRLFFTPVSALSDSTQRMVLRKAISLLVDGLRDVNFATLERARKFLQLPSRRQRVELQGGLQLFLEGKYLVIARSQDDLPVSSWPQIRPGLAQAFPREGRFGLDAGWVLEGRMLAEKMQPFMPPEDPFTVYLDADALQFPLQVRTAVAGERFQPLGMEGHSMKLSDFWVNEKIPRRVRAGWPLLVSAGQIAWIPGLRPAHFCRVQAHTERFYFFHCSQSTGYE